MDDCFDFVRAQTRFASLSPFFALVLRPFRRRNGCGQLLRGHLWIPKLGLPAPHIPTSDPTKFQDPQLSPPLLIFTRRAVDRVILPWPGYRVDEARLAADRKSRKTASRHQDRRAEYIARCGRGLATAGRVGQARLAACLDRPPAYLSAGTVCRWRNGVVWGTAAQLVGSACVVCVRVLTLGRSAV